MDTFRKRKLTDMHTNENDSHYRKSAVPWQAAQAFMSAAHGVMRNRAAYHFLLL
jgi:hypothetical protein